MSAKRDLDAAHLVIGPVLEIAYRQHLEERVGLDEFLAGGPTGRVGGGHDGCGVGMFGAGQQGHGAGRSGEIGQIERT